MAMRSSSGAIVRKPGGMSGLTGPRGPAPLAAVAARIEVERIQGDDFRVAVSEGGGRTLHTVTVEPAYARRLTGGAVLPEELVRRSFEFLLEREPKESILGSFDLSVIGRYFPGHEGEVGAAPGGREHRAGRPGRDRGQSGEDLARAPLTGVSGDRRPAARSVAPGSRAGPPVRTAG